MGTQESEESRRRAAGQPQRGREGGRESRAKAYAWQACQRISAAGLTSLSLHRPPSPQNRATGIPPRDMHTAQRQTQTQTQDADTDAQVTTQRSMCSRQRHAPHAAPYIFPPQAAATAWQGRPQDSRHAGTVRQRPDARQIHGTAGARRPFAATALCPAQLSFLTPSSTWPTSAILVFCQVT
jgi:hypothetical protein